MSDQPETYQRVSVPEAAELLGLSVATVRRRIRDGSLQAERVQRPQGIAYAVLLPIDHATDHERSASDHQVGATARLNQSEAPAAEALSSLVQATVATVLGPLVVELGASRQQNERQAEQIAQLREDRGRLTAELERAASTIVALSSVQEARTAPESAPASSEPPVPFWRRWWHLALAVAGFLVIVALMGWPR